MPRLIPLNTFFLSLVVFSQTIVSVPAQSVEDLCKQLAGGTDRERRDAAYELDQLGALAVDAVPFLIKALDDSEQQVWFHSVQCLAKIGPAAEPAIPRLIEDLSSSRGRRFSRGFRTQKWYRTANALGKIGPAAIPALLEAMDAPDYGKISGSAEALQWMGEKAMPALPTLIEKLGVEDEEVRDEIVEAIGACGPAALPDLIQALPREDPVIRSAVIRSIGEIGIEASSEAAPDLMDLWQWEPDLRVKKAILECLASMRVQGPEALPLFLQALFDPDPPIRHAALNGVLMWDPPEKTSIPLIENLLRQANREARNTGVEMIRHLGHEAGSLAPILIRDLAAKDLPDPDQVHWESALVHIGPQSIRALLEWSIPLKPGDLKAHPWLSRIVDEIGLLGLDELIKGLDYENNAPLCIALQGIRSLSDQAAIAEVRVLNLLQSPQDPTVRAVAVECLAHIGKNLKGHLSIFESACAADQPEVREAGAHAVGVMGKTGTDLIPALRPLLKDTDPAVVRAAIGSLGKLGNDAAALVPDLITLLPESDETQVAVLVQALGGIGAGEDAVVPALSGMLPGSEPALKVKILNSIGRLGESAQIAHPSVESCLNDDDPSIRSAAILCLLQIHTDPGHRSRVIAFGLDDVSYEVRKVALQAVAESGRQGSPFEAEVFGALNHPETKDFALMALKEMRPQSVPLLIQALDHEDSEIRMFACVALGRLGEKAGPAIPSLQLKLRDPYGPVQRLAEEAIERIQK